MLIPWSGRFDSSIAYQFTDPIRSSRIPCDFRLRTNLIRSFLVNTVIMASTVVDRIQAALPNIPGVEFSKVIDRREKTLINVNSANPLKARALLSTVDFAKTIGAKVLAMRKTMANGFMVLVQDPKYGKPVYIRIRRGGIHSKGISNEAGLVATIQGALQEGLKNVLFKDEVGGSISIVDVATVRQVGNEAGSRMGNRGDIELTDSSGKAHRISIKKENASGVAGLIKFLKTRRLKIQKALKPLIQSGAITLPATGLVSVPVKNPNLFKYCWFGNDIDAGGGVVIGNFEGNDHFTLDETGNTVVVNCLRVFSPKDNIDDLIEGDLTGVYLLMRVSTRPPHHMEIIGARNRRMAARYEIPNFEIDDITSEGVEELCVEDDSEGIVIYRIGKIDHMADSKEGLYFTSDPAYFDHNDYFVGYSPDQAESYVLLPNARVWDPAAEFEYFDPNGWSDIRCMMSDLEKFGIEDECDFEMPEDEGVTSTEGLARAGKKLGYDAAVIRGIPMLRGKTIDEYAIYNPSVLKPL